MKKFVAIVMVMLFALPTWAADEAARRDKTLKGAGIGAVAGGILGAVIGNNRGSGDAKKGAVIGAVAGTAVGAGIGAYMDKQERELRQIEGVEVYRTDEDELNVVVKNEVLFDYNSTALRSASKDALQEMAEVFDKYGRTTIEVEGHTDSIGSTSYNKDLSVRRASAVSRYLRNLGVDSDRLDVVGRGESDPRATNETARGRQLNRRVEIHVRANA
jgi:outer membrane protein OmpA-like peptidoglycan-associated protein